VNPLIYKGFKVVVIYNFEINLSSVAVINKGLEIPCEKNCPFPQRTPSSDPRMYLDIIVTNAKHNKIQAIQYRDDTVFVISEEQYNKLINC
jgi:hypothetical protein